YWVGTASGGVLHYDNYTWTELNKGDGLYDDQVVAITQDHDGYMWFASAKGLTRYHPDQHLPPSPLVRVAAASLEDISTAIQSVKQRELVRFNFRAVDFRTSPRDVRYRYQLYKSEQNPVSLDTGWTEWKPASEFDWTPARPGDYAFAVQSRDRH